MLLTPSKTSTNEKELVHLLRAKNQKGFALLYDNYAPTFFGLALKIVQSEDLAKDVIQDSFVKVWKKIDTYTEDKGRLFTWVLNIVRNTAIDKVRSQSFKQSTKTESIENKTINNTKHEIPVEHIGLKSFVGQLKPEHKQIVDLIYFQGFTQSETAKYLDIPLGTVKTRVKIAIRELRKITGN